MTDRRSEMCETLLNMMALDDDFQDKILWSDESKFTLNGSVIRHNCVIWNTENPHFTTEHNIQNQSGVMVWAAISSEGICGPHFFDENVNAENYLLFLQQHVFPIAARDRGIWFMQDGAPAHFARKVREQLDKSFKNRWIGRRGAIEWAPRSCDLTPCDFFPMWVFEASSLSKKPDLN